jgi:hypothetical protein
MVPKGFRRLTPRETRLNLYGGCEHVDFQGSRCSDCGYDLWTPIRRQIRRLESASKLTFEEQVKGVTEIITAPLTWDGFKYVGVEGRLPPLKIRRLASKAEDKRVRRLLERHQKYREMWNVALCQIEARDPQLRALGLEDDDLYYLKREVNTFLYAFTSRFHFHLDPEQLWPLTAAYACRLIDLINSEAETQSSQLLLDGQEERFAWWLRRLRITDETLGVDVMRRIER